MDFVFEKIYDIGKRLIPPAFWEFLEIAVMNYKGYFKRAVSGEFETAWDYYYNFVLTVFDNWRDWIDRNTLNVWEVVVKAVKKIFGPSEETDLIEGPEE